jgi:hypothetical protein
MEELQDAVLKTIKQKQTLLCAKLPVSYKQEINSIMSELRLKVQESFVAVLND